MFLLTSAIISLAAATAAATPVEVSEPDPKGMSPAEIRAFNAKLDRTHKYYIRCKRSTATGSYVQRETSCRTNEQWALADVKGNQEARDIGERMSSKAASGN